MVTTPTEHSNLILFICRLRIHSGATLHKQQLLQHVKDSGSTLAKDVSHDIVTRAENMMTHIADLNHKVGGSAADFLKNQVAKTKEKTKEYADDVEETIKEHPLSSIVISFGVGLILAKVLWPWHSSR